MMNILARKFLKSDLKKYQEDMFGMGVPSNRYMYCFTLLSHHTAASAYMIIHKTMIFDSLTDLLGLHSISSQTWDKQWCLQ